jgi:hypothetical protein
MRVDRSTTSNSSDPVDGLHRAKAGIHELENKMRRGVTAVANRIASSFHPDSAEELPAPKERQGIVSINGQDVETIRCCGNKRVS